MCANRVLRSTALLFVLASVLCPVPLGAARNPIATPAGEVRYYFHALDTHQCALASKFGEAGSTSLRTFMRSCEEARGATVQRLVDPGYRLHPQTAAYTCLAVRYTIVRTKATTFGGWYLMERTLGPAWRIDFAHSHIARGGRAVRLTRPQCAGHLPAYVRPGSGTIVSGFAFRSATSGWIALSTSSSYVPNGSCSHGIGSNCNSASTTIYRTSDAGRHWRRLLHVETAVGPPVWIHLFSSRVALVAATVGPLNAKANELFTSALFSTRDGGRRWQRFSLPANYVTETGSISFPDHKHGWLFYGGSAMGRMAIQMYHTGDSGRRWTRVYCTLIAPNPQAPFTCPHPGSAIGLAEDLVFTGLSSGWLTVYNNSGVPDLFHTVNGGVSWRRQGVGLPPGVAPPTVQRQVFPSGELLQPRFFGAVGLLPETVGYYQPRATSSRLYVFRSTDGGRTWRSSLRTRVSGQVALWQALDARHWDFIASSGSRQTIWLTPDGGAAWSKHPLQLPPGLALVGLHLTGVKRGWATAQTRAESTETALGAVLLRTTDGGAHWTKVKLP